MSDFTLWAINNPGLTLTLLGVAIPVGVACLAQALDSSDPWNTW